MKNINKLIIKSLKNMFDCHNSHEEFPCKDCYNDLKLLISRLPDKQKKPTQAGRA